MHESKYFKSLELWHKVMQDSWYEYQQAGRGLEGLNGTGTYI